MNSKRFLSIVAVTAIGLGIAIAGDLTSITASNVTATAEQSQTFGTIYDEPEDKASFRGGHPALTKWLCDNLRYPEIALEDGVQGNVTVKFVVERDGSITNPVVTEGVDKYLDKEALRVVRTMPKWIPDKNNGEVVRSYYVLDVIFKLKGIE